MLNRLRDEIHNNAKMHGWWEEERSFGEIISLCHSELSEALEEYRNGRTLKQIYFLEGDGYVKSAITYTTINIGKQKPEGIPIELADTVIRVLDYCGYKQIGIDQIMEYQSSIEDYSNFGEFIATCHHCLSRAFFQEFNYGDGHQWLAITINTINCFCEKNDIDIMTAIKVKHEFNKNRPYRHGGKKI